MGTYTLGSVDATGSASEGQLGEKREETSDSRDDGAALE